MTNNLSNLLRKEHRLLKSGKIEEAASLGIADLIGGGIDIAPTDVALARKNGQLYRAASKGLLDAISLINRAKLSSEGRYTYGPNGQREAISSKV